MTKNYTHIKGRKKDYANSYHTGIVQLLKLKNLNYLINKLLRFYFVPWVGLQPYNNTKTDNLNKNNTKSDKNKYKI